MSPPHAAIHDISRSLTPLSSIADSTDEVDRLLTGSVTPERSPGNGRVDEESDLSPLTSSDEEAEDIDTTPRVFKFERTLRPRGMKVPTPTTEHTTPNTRALSRPGPSSSADQPSRASKKRKRTETLSVNAPPTTQKQQTTQDFYVSGDRCHQCRNLPRYAFMRCTSKLKSGESCGRLFCVSCIIKRYPTDIDFNPRSRRWMCPFCGDTCNCTKCCSKRKVKYTSTANVKIDQDTLLHYAAVMSSNPSSKNGPPQKSSKSANKSKPRPAKAKRAAENLPLSPSPLSARSRRRGNAAQIATLNTAATRDIESIIRGIADTTALFEKFGCGSGEYWGVVFSNVDGGRIGVAYVGDKLPDIFFLEDDNDSDQAEGTPPAKRHRTSSDTSA